MFRSALSVIRALRTSQERLEALTAQVEGLLRSSQTLERGQMELAEDVGWLEKRVARAIGRLTGGIRKEGEKWDSSGTSSEASEEPSEASSPEARLEHLVAPSVDLQDRVNQLVRSKVRPSSRQVAEPSSPPQD